MAKDWKGNAKSVYMTNGCSNHAPSDRAEHDFYATPPEAVRMLVTELEGFDGPVVDPFCGAGHILKVLAEEGFECYGNDLYDHGFPCTHNDFLQMTDPIEADIISNPPYKYAAQFVEHALDLVTEGRKVAMFLKLSFLEGKQRKSLFEKYPPQTVWVSSSRLTCGRNGVFGPTGAVCYCWFVWQKGWRGEPVIRWFN